jgi:predicted restriction endonuclease
MSGRAWTRDELIVVCNLYCKLPFGQMHRGNPAVKELAELLGRTPSAVSMKLVNFASLDPLHQKRGVSGLKNASQADKSIWDQFNSDWARLGAESEQVYRRLRHQDQELVEGEGVPDDQPTGEGRATEAARTRTVRLGQAFFREVVLASYDHRCCICDLPDRRLLVASHIVPWAERSDLRVNPRNGLCLCALHDRAFDRGLLSVAPNCTVTISPQLRQHLPHGIIERMFVAFEGHTIHQPDKFAPEPLFLTFHQNNVFISA